MFEMTHEIVIAALLRPIAGVTGSCAGSPEGVDDDVPDAAGSFENIVAIGKLMSSDGRLHGWVYKTGGNHLRVQTVRPPVLWPPAPGAGSSGRTYSALEPFRTTRGFTLRPCVSHDYRFRKRHAGPPVH
jgi:hypothetical protein